MCGHNHNLDTQEIVWSEQHLEFKLAAWWSATGKANLKTSASINTSCCSLAISLLTLQASTCRRDSLFTKHVKKFKLAQELEGDN